MNFYNDENEKKEGAPALPRAASPFRKTSAFGKSPLFSRTAGSIVDRLKNLSRRDMALVGLGLSVLVMVPVAEYMMSQPPQENLLTGGLGGKEKLGDMPYEPGVNGLSQGSSDGSGEVITPLASRDPVSLILGSQPAQPAAPPPVYTPPTSNMRDAMRDAGREAFIAASKSAGAPTVIPKMSAGLRNMSFFGGGESSRTSGSLGGGKIIDEARSASGKAAKRSMVGPVAIAGYKGVASTPNSASKGAFEKLRAAADKSAGNFSGDSAIRSLDKAAADALDIGKGGGGMGAGGDSEKTGKTSNNSTKGYEHNRSGQSLAEKAAEMRQQKALEWEFYKKYEIPKQIINAIVGAVSSSIGKFIGNAVDGVLNPSPAPSKCWWPVESTMPIVAANYPQNRKDCVTYGATVSPLSYSGAGDKATNAGYEAYCPCGKGPSPTYDKPKGDGAAGGPTAAQNAQQANVSAGNATTALKSFDPTLETIITQTGKAAAAPTDKAVVVESAKSVAGAFSELSNIKSKAFNPLLNASQAATGSAGTYGQKIAEYRGKYNSASEKYTTMLAQVEKVETGITDCAKPTIKMKDLGGGRTATLAPADCAEAKKLITAWKDKAPKDLALVSQDIATHSRALETFQGQITEAKASIGEMQQTYDTIAASYGKIQPAPISATELSTGVIALNAMTAQLKESLPQGSAAVERQNTPFNIAASLRGLDWDTTWSSYKLALDEKLKTTEGEKWAKVMNAISSQQAVPNESAAAKDFFSNYMRNDSIKSGIDGKLTDFDRIKTDITNFETGMDNLKSGILATGIDTSNFGGTSAPVQNPPAVDDTNNGGAGNQPPPNQTVKKDPIAYAQTGLDKVEGRAEQLPATATNPDYAAAKTQADTAVAAAKTSLGKYDAAQQELAKDPANPQKKQAVADAKRDYDRKLSGANQAVTQAASFLPAGQQKTPAAPVVPVIKDEVSKTQADPYMETMRQAVHFGVGKANGAHRCTKPQSDRILSASTAADTNYNASPFTRAALGKIKKAVDKACVEIGDCRPDISSSIGCN